MLSVQWGNLEAETENPGHSGCPRLTHLHPWSGFCQFLRTSSLITYGIMRVHCVHLRILWTRWSCWHSPFCSSFCSHIFQNVPRCSSSRFFTILHDSSRFFTILHDSSRFFTILHDSSWFFTILHDSSRFFTPRWVATRGEACGWQERPIPGFAAVALSWQSAVPWRTWHCEATKCGIGGKD